MKFRSEFKSERSSLTLDPCKPVVMAGSCFSQNIAGMMEKHLWQAVNPFGTLYNPLSISAAIDIMSDSEKGCERFKKSLVKFNGVWNSKFFDSSFSAINKEDSIEEFKKRQQTFIKALQEGKILIATFGTSICYFHQEDNVVAGNCHKMPANLFSRRRIGINEIQEAWEKVIRNLTKTFGDINIIFTVSPVRHLKDGFVGNIRSKAVLQLAVEEICNNHENCLYFPAFEILNDDLRDYRFYAADLVHPSDEAIEYIWEKFIETFLDSSGLETLKEGNRQYKALHHRPMTGALGKRLHK